MTKYDEMMFGEPDEQKLTRYVGRVFGHTVPGQTTGLGVGQLGIERGFGGGMSDEPESPQPAVLCQTSPRPSPPLPSPPWPRSAPGSRPSGSAIATPPGDTRG